MDKPSGITSARAVAQVKRILPKKTKIGHTGTLDPLASGLLVMLLGRATRLSRYITALDKSYTATARFGATSDTLDADGDISQLDLDNPMPSEQTLRNTLPSFTGDIRQVPPMASALKVGGERLYNLQRRGVTIERESRPVTIHSFQLVSQNPDEETATFDISCSSGTYVRTLVADLAAHLDTGAYLTALKRTRVGHFTLQNATPSDELTLDTVQNHIIHNREVLGHLPILEIWPDARRLVCNGRPLGNIEMEGVFRVEVGGELLAVYRGDGTEARAEVVLCAG